MISSDVGVHDMTNNNFDGTGTLDIYVGRESY